MFQLGRILSRNKGFSGFVNMKSLDYYWVMDYLFKTTIVSILIHFRGDFP